MIAAGLGLGAGLTCLAAAWGPARPDLRAALGSPSAPLRADPAHQATPGWEVLARTVRLNAGRAAALVKLPAQDLDLLGRSRSRHGVHKLAWAALGLLAPGTVLTACAVLGLPMPPALAAGMVLALGALCFTVPDVRARAKAAQARAELREAVNAYLVLVALERRAGSAPQQALIHAARVADNWAFARIRAALDRAQLQRRPAWEGLRDLADRIEVPELADCADIMAASGEGASVADTLLARSRSLRGERLAHQRGQANEASERMVVPVAVLGLCFVALLVYPVIVRLLSI